jgi:hypothetical protein
MTMSESHMGDAWVFCPEELHSVESFVKELPFEVRKVMIDEWVSDRWRPVFEDDREHVWRGLARVTVGVPVRLRTAA